MKRQKFVTLLGQRGCRVAPRDACAEPVDLKGQRPGDLPAVRPSSVSGPRRRLASCQSTNLDASNTVRLSAPVDQTRVVCLRQYLSQAHSQETRGSVAIARTREIEFHMLDERLQRRPHFPVETIQQGIDRVAPCTRKAQDRCYVDFKRAHVSERTLEMDDRRGIAGAGDDPHNPPVRPFEPQLAQEPAMLVGEAESPIPIPPP